MTIGVVLLFPCIILWIFANVTKDKTTHIVCLTLAILFAIILFIGCILWPVFDVYNVIADRKAINNNTMLIVDSEKIDAPKYTDQIKLRRPDSVLPNCFITLSFTFSKECKMLEELNQNNQLSN